jgi:hypothetical protein
VTTALSVGRGRSSPVLKHALCKMQEAADESLMDAYFKEMDKDRFGVVDFRDVLAFLMSHAERGKEVCEIIIITIIISHTYILPVNKIVHEIIIITIIISHT